MKRCGSLVGKSQVIFVVLAVLDLTAVFICKVLVSPACTGCVPQSGPPLPLQVVGLEASVPSCSPPRGSSPAASSWPLYPIPYSLTAPVPDSLLSTEALLCPCLLLLMNNFRVLWIMLKKMKSLEQPTGTMWKDLSLAIQSSKKDCTRRTRFRIPSGIS